MSDLLRKTMKKPKQRDPVAELSVVSEDGYSEPSLNELIQQEQANELLEPLPSDETILESYQAFIHQVFPIIEDYVNEVNSIRFKTYFKPPKSGPILIFIHGAGSSAMTFGKLSAELINLDDSLGIFTYNLRGHGNSSNNSLDYSLNSFVDDFEFVLNQLITTHNISNSIYLIGHSLGGAILSKFIQSKSNDEIATLKINGIVMLDIVEETAILALNSMPLFISKRPKKFSSLNDAIVWHMGFLLNNEDSAKISVPDLLKHDLTWKMDLELTQPFWNTWFVDLSKNFLSFPNSKLLILSTHETLDKELIIGQMQGKYQLVVFNNFSKAGHFIQEDLPSKLCLCLLDFIKRNELKQELGVIPTWGTKVNK